MHNVHFGTNAMESTACGQERFRLGHSHRRIAHLTPVRPVSKKTHLKKLLTHMKRAMFGKNPNSDFMIVPVIFDGSCIGMPIGKSELSACKAHYKVTC